MTARDGRVSQLEQVYIRGSMVRGVLPQLWREGDAELVRRGPEGGLRAAGRGSGVARLGRRASGIGDYWAEGFDRITTLLSSSCLRSGRRPVC